uniref:Terminase n=1 Tax=Streptomyces violaceusniger TaxID=68280 RepID=A0A6F8Z236_STRVO|nr:hypothetical protein [Streptomyces violaceusniger]
MAKAPDPGFVVDFPTIWAVPYWIEAHCPVPDGFRQGEQLELYPWQLWCTVNHYRVRPTACVGQQSTAFRYRRSQVVAPQKTGKGPWSATIVLAEACGPVVFAGWAAGGERYRCADHGCACGWWYEYEPGERMGRPWATPLIQLTATSEDQVANVYRPLQAMVKLGPLGDRLKVGEEFIRIGSRGRIDVVTSSARSRLGNPINFALQDETGTWTKENKLLGVADTQRRGVSGMSGRSMETTNSWDPSESSVAQLTAASKQDDIFRYHPQAPKSLSYGYKRQRRKIHAVVYAVGAARRSPRREISRSGRASRRGVRRYPGGRIRTPSSTRSLRGSRIVVTTRPACPAAVRRTKRNSRTFTLFTECQRSWRNATARLS